MSDTNPRSEQKPSSKRKNCLGCLGIALAIPVLLFVVLMAYNSWETRSMAFDSAVWKQNPDSVIRERMLDGAIEAIKPGMTKEEVADLLGPVSSGGGAMWQYLARRYDGFISDQAGIIVVFGMEGRYVLRASRGFIGS